MRSWIESPLRDLEMELAGLQAGFAARALEITDRTKGLMELCVDDAQRESLAEAADAELAEGAEALARAGEEAVDRTERRVRVRAGLAALAPVVAAVGAAALAFVLSR